MENQYKEQAKVFKALCDENMLIILEMLQGGEKCACHLLEDLSISQSTLSHHMNILCESEIVVGRKEGKWMYYSIDASGSQKAIELLRNITKCEGNYCSACCD